MPIWKKPTDRNYLEKTLNKNTLGETLGIEITEVGEDYLEGRMPVDHRTCLLYTSPSPRDLSTSRMPSSA